MCYSGNKEYFSVIKNVFLSYFTNTAITYNVTNCYRVINFYSNSSLSPPLFLSKKEKGENKKHVSAWHSAK